VTRRTARASKDPKGFGKPLGSSVGSGAQRDGQEYLVGPRHQIQGQVHRRVAQQGERIDQVQVLAAGGQRQFARQRRFPHSRHAVGE
jgi:hypothetical protein